MAKAVSFPEHIKIPLFTSDVTINGEQVEALYAEVKAYCKKSSSCPDAGELITFPLGEVDVMYAVLSYTELVSVEPWAPKLTTSQLSNLTGEDILTQVKHEQAFQRQTSY